MFFKPKAKDIAQKNLEEAERNVLHYENQERLARHMRLYYEETIADLNKRLMVCVTHNAESKKAQANAGY